MIQVVHSFILGRRSKSEIEKPPSSSDIHQIRRPDSHPPNQMIVAFDPDRYIFVFNVFIYVHVHICICGFAYIYFSFFKVYFIFVFSFEVDDNFESTSDNTIVSVEPKQADPSSHYYIDGLDPDRQVII